MVVTPGEFAEWLKDKPARYAKVTNGSAEVIAKYMPSNYQVIASAEDYVIVAGVDMAGWTLDDYIIPRLASGLYWAEELPVVNVEVYHNISRDAFFGLNVVFDKDHKREAQTDIERHLLVKVFEYRTYLDDPVQLGDRAFAAYNNGSGQEDSSYFGRRLRSLSVGDVLIINGEAYSCGTPGGWDKHERAELRIVSDFDPVAMYGNRAITVPWVGGEQPATEGPAGLTQEHNQEEGG